MRTRLHGTVRVRSSEFGVSRRGLPGVWWGWTQGTEEGVWDLNSGWEGPAKGRVGLERTSEDQGSNSSVRQAGGLVVIPASSVGDPS